MSSVAELTTNPEQQETLKQAELAGVDLARLPRHIAVIMDGNGRWAKAMHRPRIEGHRAGIKSVREIVRSCRQLQIPYLTLYAFSAENWKRPNHEINALMVLLCTFLKREIKEMRDNGIRLNAIGHLADLPQPVQRALQHAKEQTAAGTKMQLNLALSYGGRQELVDAAKKLAIQALNNEIDPNTITQEMFASQLTTSGMPDPDLLIRTSGELRVSNFLLWQIAYSEIWITPTLWPDFRKPHLFESLHDFQGRHRRFGGVDIDGAL